MRLPSGFVKHSRASLRRAVVVAVVLLVGCGEGLALALLPADAGRSESGRPDRAAAFPSATAAPTRFDARHARRAKRQRGGSAYYRETSSRHVPASTKASFMGLYREAARTFGVSWRLLASIHRQETAFSTHPSTYHGLNAYGCCAGPMQFNVKNGPVSTWELYRQSFRQGNRPRRYPHRTRSHPSVYDDFDAMMAAGALLRDAGAGEALDGGSWAAAYAYYGHDLFGIDYANQVMARAQGWEFDGFCLNCPLDEVLVGAFDDAYGSDTRRQLLAADRRKKQEERSRRSKRRAAKARREAAERARRRAARRSRDRPEGARPAPKPPRKQTTPPPEAQTPAPPPAVTEPPLQPTAPQPPQDECTKLERLLGCDGPGA